MRRAIYAINKALASLKLCAASDSKATLHDLADRYGVSAERIRQLEQNAMKKMRGALAAAAIDSPVGVTDAA